MRELEQSTATDRLVFLTDSADGRTGKTGLTLTVTLSKAGGAFAAMTVTVTERGSGWYALAITAAHTDTLGDFALHVTATGADPADVLFVVVKAAHDFTVSAADSTSVTLPTTYQSAATLPDDDRYTWTALRVTAGTGVGQIVLLTTAGAGARQYNVLSGSMPVQLDNTSKCVVLGQYRANVKAVGDDTGAGSKLARGAKSMVLGTVGVGSTTTSVVTSALDPLATNTDQFVGRLIQFADDTTTADLRGQTREITANTTGGSAAFTVSALTDAPASGDTFVIV